MIQIEVKKGENESTASLIRRYSKRMQTSGILKKVKSLKYQERSKSDFVKKKNALHRIAKKKEIEKKQKLGKISNAHNKKYYKR